MRVGRRRFFEGAAGGALVACTPPRHPAAPPVRIEDVLGAALDSAKRAGAVYADARVVRRRDQNVGTREDHVAYVSDDESYGVGVRVLLVQAGSGGATQSWGFAASMHVGEESASRAAERAVAIARADAGPRKRPIVLAPVARYREHWATPLAVDPFEVPIVEKVALLRAIWADARVVKGVKYMDGRTRILREEKTFASTEGSLIDQRIVRVEAAYTLTATDDSGDAVTRAHELPPMQAGWEHVSRSSFQRDARKMGEDAVEKLRAPRLATGKRDLVLAPSNLWLVIHESIGHSTELDRALGYEANFAGTSFATPDQIGKLEIARDTLTFFADKTTPGGLATCGWDDDGEKTQKWNLVDKGKLAAFQTTRDQAAWIGEKRSRGCSYAEDWRAVPFQRMPNVSLAPAERDVSIDDLVAGVDDGVLITGDGSWSIDHQRYNFQFGGQMFHAIRSGKIAGALRDVAYQSNTIDFWHACDAIGGARHFALHGTLVDGKGEPQQSNPVSHGCPPARFRGVRVLDTREEKS
ncbi:MAG TPA: TldD/PmbA family protein [Polyangiaceae bacterium]